MWTLEMRSDGQTRRLTMNRSDRGWQMQEEHDARLVRRVTFADWQLMYCAIKEFELSGRWPSLADGACVHEAVPGAGY
jgi:hypothetical protein